MYLKITADIAKIKPGSEYLRYKPIEKQIDDKVKIGYNKKAVYPIPHSGKGVTT